ncbi:MAG: tetratricopeptide repeat protein [Thermodesulfobacteriota bacterium]
MILHNNTEIVNRGGTAFAQLLFVVFAAVLTCVVYFSTTGAGISAAGGRGTPRPDETSADIGKAKEHFERGIRYSLNREYDKAIVEYQKSLRYNHHAAVVHSNLGFAYFDKGDYDKAIESQKNALKIDGANSNAYYGIAMAYEKKGLKDDAIKSWEKFMEIAEPHTLWWKKARQRLKRLQAEKDI